jgi:hypothetical protein
VGLATRREVKFGWVEHQAEGPVLGELGSKEEAMFWGVLCSQERAEMGHTIATRKGTRWAIQQQPGRHRARLYKTTRRRIELGHIEQPERVELRCTIWA